jgi:hypothetical protein
MFANRIQMCEVCTTTTSDHLHRRQYLIERAIFFGKQVIVTRVESSGYVEFSVTLI